MSAAPPLSAWHGRIVALTGWRRRGLAAATGAVAALALPPLHLVPLLWLAMPVLAWLLEGSANRRAAFGAGWWFGFGYCVTGAYWVAFAMLVQPEKFAWMIPFAVFGLSIAIGMYYGLATLTARILYPRGGWGQVFILACVWTVFEWLRGWLFTGIPWNLIGTVWTFSDAMLQPAALIGIYGLSLLTMLLALAPAALPAAPTAWRGVAAGVVALALVWGGGAWRLAQNSTQNVDDVRLRLVQPNIPQKIKWSRNLRARHIERQVAMSRTAPVEPGAPPPTHVIWGETMVPTFVNRDPAARRMIAAAAPPGGALIAGGLRRPDDPKAPFQVWNSLFVVDSAGAIRETYDKFHLLPFGEYVPFREVLKIAS